MRQFQIKKNLKFHHLIINLFYTNKTLELYNADMVLWITLLTTLIQNENQANFLRKNWFFGYRESGLPERSYKNAKPTKHRQYDIGNQKLSVVVNFPPPEDDDERWLPPPDEESVREPWPPLEDDEKKPLPESEDPDEELLTGI